MEDYNKYLWSLYYRDMIIQKVMIYNAGCIK